MPIGALRRARRPAVRGIPWTFLSSAAVRRPRDRVRFCPRNRPTESPRSDVPRTGIALGNANFRLRLVSPAPQQASRSQCHQNQVRTTEPCGPPCAVGTGARIEELLLPRLPQATWQATWLQATWLQATWLLCVETSGFQAWEPDDHADFQSIGECADCSLAHRFARGSARRLRDDYRRKIGDQARSDRH